MTSKTKKNLVNDGWQQLLKLINKTPSEEQLNTILQLFLTHEERDDLAKRYLIVKELLSESMTQRDMAVNLEVSIAKITRGSNGLKSMDEEQRELLTKLIAE